MKLQSKFENSLKLEKKRAQERSKSLFETLKAKKLSNYSYSESLLTFLRTSTIRQVNRSLIPMYYLQKCDFTIISIWTGRYKGNS